MLAVSMPINTWTDEPSLLCVCNRILVRRTIKREEARAWLNLKITLPSKTARPKMSTYCTFPPRNAPEEQNHLQWLKAYQRAPENGAGKLRGRGRMGTQRHFPTCWVSVLMVSCYLDLSKLIELSLGSVWPYVTDAPIKLFLREKHGLGGHVSNTSPIKSRIRRKCKKLERNQKEKGQPSRRRGRYVQWNVDLTTRQIHVARERVPQ